MINAQLYPIEPHSWEGVFAVWSQTAITMIKGGKRERVARTQPQHWGFQPYTPSLLSLWHNQYVYEMYFNQKIIVINNRCENVGECV
jgi:hypothetical protein